MVFIGCCYSCSWWRFFIPVQSSLSSGIVMLCHSFLADRTATQYEWSTIGDLACRLSVGDAVHCGYKRYTLQQKCPKKCTPHRNTTVQLSTLCTGPDSPETWNSPLPKFSNVFNNGLRLYRTSYVIDVWTSEYYYYYYYYYVKKKSRQTRDTQWVEKWK